uniref:Ionotropic glutamate receptor C-terminal domain-containing protein n=1 Tax=Ornithorhynchus anatinus TaxID=9258 RepID=F7CX32_ORNAN
KAVSVRLVATTWWVFAALVLSVYAASLSALLRSPAEQGPVNSFEDLIGQKVMEFGTINGSSTHQFFQSSKDPLHRMVLERMERQQGRALVSSHEEGVERVLSSNYALIGETVSLDLAVARHCGLVRLPDVTVLRGLSLATTKGSPWAEELSVALLQLAESGVLEALRHKWWEPSCAPQEPLRRGSLGPQSLGPAFLILAAGLTLGLAVAVGELALKTCRVDARPEVRGDLPPGAGATQGGHGARPRGPTTVPSATRPGPLGSAGERDRKTWDLEEEFPPRSSLSALVSFIQSCLLSLCSVQSILESTIQQ